MQDNAVQEDKAILRNRIAAVEGRPKKCQTLFEEIRNHRARWLKPLVALAVKEPPPIGPMAIKFLDSIVSEADGFWSLMGVLCELPNQCSVLADLAAKVTARLLRVLPEPVADTPFDETTFLIALSERSRDANRPEEALSCAKRAVEVSGSLPGNSPWTQRRRIKALRLLGKRQAERGAGELALQTVESAFRMACDLARQGDAADHILVADVAVVLANRLSAVGEWDRAMELAAKAKVFFDRFDKDDSILGDLALVEHSLANHLMRSGRHKEALPYAESADRQFIILAGNQPEHWQEYSAIAAHTYASLLYATEDFERGYNRSQFSVQRMQLLFERQPKRFGRGYSTSLIQFSRAAEALSSCDIALEAVDRGLMVAGELARLQRRREWRLEASAHHRRFELLLSLQRVPEAEQAIRCALDCYRHLPEQDHQAGVDHAEAFCDLADLQSGMGHPVAQAAAARTAERALTRISKLASCPTDKRQLMEYRCRRTLVACLVAVSDRAGSVREAESYLAARRLGFARRGPSDHMTLADDLLWLAGVYLGGRQPRKAAKLAYECISESQVRATGTADKVAAVRIGRANTVVAAVQRCLLEDGESAPS